MYRGVGVGVDEAEQCGAATVLPRQAEDIQAVDRADAPLVNDHAVHESPRDRIQE